MPLPFGARLRALSAVIAVAAAVLALLLGAVGISLWDAREAARQQAAQALENLALSLGRGVSRSLEAYNIQLCAVAEGTQEVDRPLDAVARTLLTEDVAAGVFGTLMVTDATGRVVGASATVPPGLDLSGTPYFRAHRERADLGLVVSDLEYGRESGRPKVVLSRRLGRPGDSFTGIAVGNIKIDFFSQVFARFQLGDGGVITLISDNGQLLASAPIRPERIGADVNNSSVMRRMRAEGPGTFEAVAMVDGRERLYNVQHLADLPFVLMVGTSTKGVYKEWNRHAQFMGGTLVGFLLLFGGAAALLREELRRRRTAEMEASKAQQATLAEAKRAHCSEAKLSTYLDQLADGVIAMHVLPDGRIVFDRANAAAAAILDLPPQLVGREPHEVFSPEYARSALTRLHECVEAGQAIRYERIIEDAGGIAGRRRVVDAHLVPVRDPGQGGRISLILCSFRDVTRLSEVEQQLLQAQRMEAVGQLTAGVAHDFNNLLQAQMSGLGLLLDCIPGDDRARRYVEVAIDKAEQGARLTHSLLSFSRQQVLRPEAVDVPALLNRLRVLLSRTLDPRILLRIDVEAELVPPLADPAQLESALLNLCLNARDAMGERGGRLLIEACGGTALAAGAPAWVDPANCMVLAVTDEGSGMDAATLARVCEPFFTTKGVGKGSGLGLSMVQGFARQSGGELHIQSAPGKGTRVEVWLPQARAAFRTDRDGGSTLPGYALGHSGAERPWGAGRRVLLVDDNPGVREFLAEALENTGFAVTQREGGDEALEALRRPGACFEALVTDYAMPGMTGGELVREARRLWPGLPALIVTGYAEAEQLGEVPEGVEVAHKPFRMDELVERVAGLVEAKTSAAEPAQ